MGYDDGARWAIKDLERRVAALEELGEPVLEKPTLLEQAEALGKNATVYSYDIPRITYNYLKGLRTGGTSQEELRIILALTMDWISDST